MGWYANTAKPAEVEVPIPVRFGDTDPYGVIYCASYFRYCHHGIEEFLKFHHLPPHEVFRNQAEGYGLPIVSAACNFLKPVKYGDELRLVVSLAEIKEKSLTFHFRFYKQGLEEIIAKGEAVMVAIGPDWRARALPDSILRILLNPGSHNRPG
ncbi:MAG: acyl-CoA thioesterase [Syntrophobacteraceae bacterium]